MSDPSERDPGASALLTDLYQLTMLSAYLAHGMTEVAAFEFFARALPRGRGFLVAAGLDQVLSFLEHLRCTEDELAWLAAERRLDARAIDWLARFRFTGDVDAMPEGTPCFPHEPLLRVTAPLPEAQLVETRIVSLLQLETVVATKAARAVLVAPGKRLVDFGLRRAHGAEAGLLAARAAYLAGYAGTATVLAGQRFGIPLFGTMAHSFVQAHASERLAFERFARAYPDGATLLIDTYDTEAGAAKVLALADGLRDAGVRIGAVRLDSGDLGAHARRVRRILDDGGHPEIRIFASGGLDEHRIARLVADGAPIDGFGVGTSLVTSEDAPALDCAYKLVEYAGAPRRKRSEGKATWPGRKQVFRRVDAAGRACSDVVGLAGDAADGQPLLVPAMRGGRRVPPTPTLAEARARCGDALARLPTALTALDAAAGLPVTIAPSVRALADEADRLVREAAAD